MFSILRGLNFRRKCYMLNFNLQGNPFVEIIYRVVDIWRYIVPNVVINIT